MATPSTPPSDSKAPVLAAHPRDASTVGPCCPANRVRVPFHDGVAVQWIARAKKSTRSCGRRGATLLPDEDLEAQVAPCAQCASLPINVCRLCKRQAHILSPLCSQCLLLFLVCTGAAPLELLRSTPSNGGAKTAWRYGRLMLNADPLSPCPVEGCRLGFRGSSMFQLCELHILESIRRGFRLASLEPLDAGEMKCATEIIPQAKVDEAAGRDDSGPTADSKEGSPPAFDRRLTQVHRRREGHVGPQTRLHETVVRHNGACYISNAILVRACGALPPLRDVANKCRILLPLRLRYALFRNACRVASDTALYHDDEHMVGAFKHAPLHLVALLARACPAMIIEIVLLVYQYSTDRA
jgi:hypothetical protein